MSVAFLSNPRLPGWLASQLATPRGRRLWLLGIVVLSLLPALPTLYRAALVNTAAVELARSGFLAVAPGSVQDVALAQANGYLEVAGQLAPDSVAIANLRGQVALQRGQTDLAIAHLSRAQELEPSNSAAGWWLGQLYLTEGRDEDAVAAWRTAGLGPMVFAEVRRYVNARQLDEALRWYAYAAAIEPESPAGYQGQAVLYEQLNRPLDALAMYLQGASRFPQQAWGYVGAAKLLAAPGADPARASELRQRCIEQVADRPACER